MGLDRLFDLLIDSLKLFQISHIVPQYEQGVILRFGKMHRRAMPGLNFVWPFFIEKMLTTNVLPEPAMVGPQSLTTADGKRVVVEALVAFTIDDATKFLLGLEGGNAAVLFLCHGAVARFFERRTWSELTAWSEGGEEDEDNSPDAPARPRRRYSPSASLATILRRQLKQFGVGIHDAQITGLTDARSIRLMGVHI